MVPWSFSLGKENSILLLLEEESAVNKLASEKLKLLLRESSYSLQRPLVLKT